MTLSVLVPNSILDANFISSTVAETDYSAWASGTTYALGDKCISTTAHRIYESAVAGNIAKDPTLIANQMQNAAGIIYWVDVGPTNKWAIFDNTVSTPTTTTSPFTIVVTPGFFNAVYLDGLDADTLSLVVKDATGGTIIYSSGTIALEASTPSDYYEYWFSPYKPKKKYLIEGIDQYNLAEITITLTKSSGSVKCGIITFGDLRPLGTTLNGAKAKPKTYSYIATDTFGNTTIKRRKATTDMNCTAFLDIEEASTVLETVQAVLDVPCVWVASECAIYDGLTVFGLGSGELTYPDSSKSELSLNILGLI